MLLNSTSLMVTLEIESFSRRMVRTVAGKGFENDDDENEEEDETLATSSAESVANATPPRLTWPVEVSTETEAPARRSGGGGCEESSRVSSRSRGIGRGEKKGGRASFFSLLCRECELFSFFFLQPLPPSRKTID